MPKVSVLMGVRLTDGRTGPLREAVESILGQSLRDLELLVCPDGSSPQALAVLEALAAADPRLVLVAGDGSGALPQKLNRCLARARGEYLARMDGDDWSYPQRLERQAAYLDSHPQVGFVGCCADLFDSRRGVYGQRLFPPAPRAEDFRFNMPFLHPALVFRRQALEEAGGYSLSRWAVLCEDYDLLLRLYALGWRGENLQEKLIRYRVEPEDWKKRRMGHRLNEAVTRFCRFRQLGMLPRALPYVVKPLAVGLLPHGMVEKLKEWRARGWKSC